MISITQFDILTVGAQLFGLLFTLFFFYYLSITFMERVNHSELANLEAISRAVTSENSLGLLKVFIDRNRLMRDGLSPNSIQVRLIEGEGVPWLSALMNPVCIGIRLYGAFPLRPPLNDASLKSQLKMFGVYQRAAPGR